jgi:hypothetical protein
MKLYDVEPEESEGLSDSNYEDQDMPGNGFDFRPKKFEKEKVSGWKM